MFRFTHIVVDHVISTHVTPVIFVTTLEGHVFKYAQTTTDGDTVRACLVEVLELGCDGSGRTTPRSIQLDAKQVRNTAEPRCSISVSLLNKTERPLTLYY